MIIRKLRQRVIDHSINAPANVDKVLETKWNQIQHVLLLIDASDISHKRITKLREIFQSYNFKNDCFLYSDELQDQIKNTLQLTKKDFKYKVKISDDIKANKLFQTDYDVIFCFNPRNRQMLQMTLTQLSAGLKIGCEPEVTELYDITIVLDKEQDVSQFLQSAIYLLRNTSGHDIK